MEPESVELLKQARRRTTALIDELLRHEAALQRRPGRLSPDALQAGLTRIHAALAGARRTLQCLNQLLNQTDVSDHDE